MSSEFSTGASWLGGCFFYCSVVIWVSLVQFCFHVSILEFYLHPFYSLTVSVFFHLECRAEDRLEQPNELFASEGGDVTIRCKYITDDPYPYLFWYQQKLRTSPIFILNTLTSGGGQTDSEFEKRFNASIDKTQKTVPLKIQDLQISDSAVYFCALRPTVMETYPTLVQKALAHTPLIWSFLTKRQGLKIRAENFMNVISFSIHTKSPWVEYNFASQ